MVDKITLIPESIRAYGNVLLEDRDIDEYGRYKSALFENVAIINGETLTVFHTIFNEYAVGFNFNSGTKELYVSTDDDTVITDFSFDDTDKELQFASTMFLFDYDDNLKALYVTDEIPVVYSLEFDEASYTAVSGVATVSAVLLADDEPVSGATITFTSDESTTTTATTDSNGVATATITFTDSTTLTASYESVTATATITVQSILFYDACDSSAGLSNYGSIIAVSSSTTTNYTDYNSTENAYLVRANGDWGCIPITALTGEDNYKISAYFKPKSSSSHLYRVGFGLLESGTTYPYFNFRFQGNGELTFCRFEGGSEYDVQRTSNLSNVDQYHKMEVIKQGNNYTFNYYDTDNTTVLKSYTATFSLTTAVIGLYICCGSSYGGYVKEIEAISL